MLKIPCQWRQCRTLLAIALVLLLSAGGATSSDGDPWSQVRGPVAGHAEAIGGFARGCLVGAQTLPADGPGYEVIHLERRRYYGHPDTVAFVERLGRATEAAGLPAFYVGDMAQARGGPLPYGHTSHQTGLDVDIWFTLATQPRLAPAERESISLPSMLQPNWQAVNPRRFGPRQVALLRLAASDPKVERIFVNPVIKTAICRAAGPRDAPWLHKLRPWWRHDDHFHVRLHCPADSPDCESQAPIPPGDGCDSVLASWVRDQRPPPPPETEAAPRRLPVLPAACRAILAAP